MTRVRKEELLDWANNPPDYKIVGYATSEEEVQTLRDWVIGERLYLLYELASEELLSRQGGTLAAEVEQPAESDFDFSALPLKCTLNKRECHILAGQLWSSRQDGWYWGQPAAVRSWNEVAGAGAALGGFGLLSSKYTNMPYIDYTSRDGSVTKTAEEMFQEALSRSRHYSRRGCQSALLMDGINHVDYASLDLDMIEQDMNTHGYTHFFPISFWRGMIQAKREADKASGYHTYADVLREVTDGVYLAPYLDETVKRSGQFLSRDDIVAIAIEQGLDFSNGNTLFAEIVHVLDTRGVIRESFFDRGWRYTSRLGAIFFKKELLLEARFALESKNAPKRTRLIDAAIKKYLSEDAVPIDEEEDRDAWDLILDD